MTLARFGRRLALLTILGLSLAADAPTTAPAGVPERGRDPWVFRCVLDGRPRVAVVALSHDFWAAWDTADCGIYKVWRGGMDLTGSVYDTKHGPQPQTTGTTLATFADADAWQVVRGGRAAPASPRFLGYAVDGQTSVSFRYRFDLGDGRAVTVVEAPSLRDGALVRRFEVDGLPDGVALQCRLDSGGGRHVVRGATALSRTTGRGDVALLRLDRDGTAVAESRWPDAE